MKLPLLASALALAGCTTYYPVEVPVQPASQAIAYNKYLPTDPATQIFLQCDALGMLDQQSARLCAMRGIDRIQVKPSPLPRGIPQRKCAADCLPRFYPDLQ